jgi:MFS family permease
MVLLGAGAGLCFPALMTLAMSGVGPQDAGLASGLVNTTAQVGSALGLAVLSTVSTSRADGLRAAGETAVAATLGGYHVAFWTAAGIVLAAVAVAGLLLTSRRAAGTPGSRVDEELQVPPALRAELRVDEEVAPPQHGADHVARVLEDQHPAGLGHGRVLFAQRDEQ